MSLMLLGILNSQAAGGGGGAFDLLETTTLTSTATSVTFSGLGAYSDYKHLQIRAVVRNTTEPYLRFNGDSGSNYKDHTLRGIGTSVQSTSLGSGTSIPISMNDSGGGSNQRYGAGVIDILDFSNSSKNTTTRALTGKVDPDVYPAISLQSGAWFNTSAITSIVFGGGTFQAGSRFSLYGIKGA